jgi:hypothetical protein
MWNLLNCYLSGRHEFSVWSEPGAIFLRCIHCGKRSSGWSIGAAAHLHVSPQKRPTARWRRNHVESRTV